MDMSHLPRNGQYELFIYLGKMHCFDDPDLHYVLVNDDMINWLNQQDKRLCRPYKAVSTQTNPCCYYLKPEMYLIWKLKWVC